MEKRLVISSTGCLPCPFLRPSSSFLYTAPPLGMHVPSHSSLNLRSVIWSSVRPCMLGGSVMPWSASSGISGETCTRSTNSPLNFVFTMQNEWVISIPFHTGPGRACSLAKKVDSVRSSSDNKMTEHGNDWPLAVSSKICIIEAHLYVMRRTVFSYCIKRE